MNLIDVPAGLFLHDGTLCFASEYGEYYVVESGEFFWGGVNTVEERNNLEVTPVDPESLRPRGRWLRTAIPTPDWYGTVDGWACSECGHTFEDKSKRIRKPTAMKYCLNCGAKMEEEDDDNP